jgi:hypothetical protein
MPGEAEYEELWGVFLVDFTRHLKERGWLDKTAIAMDERGLEDMLKVIAFVKKTAPGLKFALAGAYHEEINSDVHDYCLYVNQTVPNDKTPYITRQKIQGASGTRTPHDFLCLLQPG